MNFIIYIQSPFEILYSVLINQIRAGKEELLSIEEEFPPHETAIKVIVERIDKGNNFFIFASCIFVIQIL